MEAEPAPEIEWHRGGILLQVGPSSPALRPLKGAGGFVLVSFFVSALGTSSTLKTIVNPYRVWSPQQDQDSHLVFFPWYLQVTLRTL